MADLVYATAPHHIAPASFSTTAEREKAEKEPVSEEHAMHGWWFSPSYKPVQADGYLVGYKESVQYVRDIVKQQGPFDGILGFSQGACFAALLTEIMETEQTPFKFSIIVAGFKPTKQTATNMMLTKENKVKTPSLHYIGDLDTIVLPENMSALVEAFEKPKIFRHTGGHYLPSTAASRKALLSFLEQFN
ncbi:hypothetical protein HPULCUR_007020 [Helicostylum pulchrum]|uniref:Serine hydrolase domain-containing protein n=1 Tax=Helicostylum pulchrum TaxID=562976 RepID=A0ABP9Y3K1_9FUNG